MKALLINAVCGIRSTGTICVNIAETLEKEGYEVKIAYGRESHPDKYNKYAIKIGNKIDIYTHALLSKIFDRRGFGSKRATAKFLRWAEEYDPDLLWLHNLHDYFINISMLFEWIKSRPQMEVKWTQHDCWAFTGGCMHFEMSKCVQWKTECVKCDKRLLNYRPIIYQTSKNFTDKQAAFLNVRNLEIIAPSKWLAHIISESFLNKYKIVVKHNTIDHSVFKPTKGDFRKKYNLHDKFIILGVASAWSKAKGLFDFYNLAKKLDSNYQIVLVGLTKRQIKDMPSTIIGIQRTNSKTELAEIYTTADVFLNLTYQDTYPTVNLESQACGTPVITYNTGGSPESVPKSNVVDQGNIEKIYQMIISRNFSSSISEGEGDTV